MSSDDEHMNDFTPNNFTSKTSSTPKTNGSARTGPVPTSAASTRVRRNLRFSGRETNPQDDDVEELTIVRRITRIFNSSESARSEVKRLIDYTPEPVQRYTRQVTNVVPVPVILSFFLLTIITSLWYFALFPTIDGCLKTWDSFIENITNGCSFLREMSLASLGFGVNMCSAILLFIKSSTFALWSLLASPFSSTSQSKFVYSSVDDPIDAQTLARIEDALRVYGKTLESLDSRLTDLKHEVNTNKGDIELLKRTCCKDPKELELLISSGVKAFWVKMFPTLSASSSDDELKKQVQEQLSIIAKEAASGVHGQQIGEFNDRFQRKLDEVTQQVLVQIHELKSRQENADSRQTAVKNEPFDDTINRVTIQRMITNAISMYDADKTGIPDFALEPSGKFSITLPIVQFVLNCSLFRWFCYQYKMFGNAQSKEQTVQDLRYSGVDNIHITEGCHPAVDCSRRVLGIQRI